jgi:hypothetical protein
MSYSPSRASLDAALDSARKAARLRLAQEVEAWVTSTLEDSTCATFALDSPLATAKLRAAAAAGDGLECGKSRYFIALLSSLALAPGPVDDVVAAAVCDATAALAGSAPLGVDVALERAVLDAALAAL